MRHLLLLAACSLVLAPACTRLIPLVVASASPVPVASPTDSAPVPFPATPTPVATATPVTVDRSGISTPVPVLATPRGTLPVASVPPLASAPSALPGTPAPTPVATPVVVVPTPAAGPTLVDLVGGQPTLTKLVAALSASGLTATLKDAGPFTLFAPSNAAFDALPVGVLAGLMAPGGKARLTQILNYHIVLGRYDTARLRDGLLPTLEGQKLLIDVTPTFTVAGKPVVTPDLAAGNGSVHILDTVLMPADLVPEAATLPALAALRSDLTTLTRALDLAELAPLLRTAGPFTLFAPTDLAFDKLPAAERTAIFAPANKAKLVSLLQYHIVPARVTAAQLAGVGGLPTLFGAGLPVVVLGMPAPRVGGATISLADAFAGNGVLHVIDGVCIPPGFVLPR